MAEKVTMIGLKEDDENLVIKLKKHYEKLTGFKISKVAVLHKALELLSNKEFRKHKN